MSHYKELLEPYDKCIVIGVVLSWVWSYIIQPQHGELAALGLGLVPLTFGLYYYIPKEHEITEIMIGMLAVSFGGLASPSIFGNSQFGDFLTGGGSFGIACGFSILVVLFAIILRRKATDMLSAQE